MLCECRLRCISYIGNLTKNERYQLQGKEAENEQNLNEFVMNVDALMDATSKT